MLQERRLTVIPFYRTIQRWAHAQHGAVAVEFALAALPFFMLVIGIIEVAMLFAAGTVLEGGTMAASRTIRTGQTQQAANPSTYFRQNLCAKIGALIPCAQLRYEVLHPAGNSFNDADGMEPSFDANGNLITAGFDAGGVSDVVVIRTSYRYHFITPFIGALLSKNADNSATMVSTVTLRSEPYAFEN